ncbi:hypothetical protein WICPIJ_004208 [Wickerhamomyces pijperi]|uniref:Cation/H+ exchanger transmembrane domain-containing protein n=1 Tax=Wickerhamomyces pijperi TaxID=599730 RepID=A0A9P8TM94_WICPI|nr:hypothetical protein WICPIJ_004208 [Wickerhamomyces pijperi]
MFNSKAPLIGEMICMNNGLVYFMYKCMKPIMAKEVKTPLVAVWICSKSYSLTVVTVSLPSVSPAREFGGETNFKVVRSFFLLMMDLVYKNGGLSNNGTNSDGKRKVQLPGYFFTFNTNSYTAPFAIEEIRRHLMRRARIARIRRKECGSGGVVEEFSGLGLEPRPESAHVAYLLLGGFTCFFFLFSNYIKESLYLGEAIISFIYGLIIGPHSLNWFNPIKWGNSDRITLEISRVVLCLQIFISAVELPKKYMLNHGLSVLMLLLPAMTMGWLIMALFMWVLIPGFSFADALVVSGTTTATDPVLAAAVVKGKFAESIPERIRFLLSSESGCNDGMVFPFIFLGVDLIIHTGHAGEIAKDWICITVLYQCGLGILIGAVIGFSFRKAIQFAKKRDLIDRESFLGYSALVSLFCAGVGSTLGVDELLVSFAAGNAFGWDAWHIRESDDSLVNSVFDLIINLLYFVYFGAIIPWQYFNDSQLGLNVWRLVVLGIIMIFLRRIPIVLAFKKVVPDIRTWKEAWFTGHFGPIGVGSVYSVMLARSAIEGAYTSEATPLSTLPGAEHPKYHLLITMWPIVSFLVLVSLVVHGLSVCFIILYQRFGSKLLRNESKSDSEENGMAESS